MNNERAIEYTVQISKEGDQYVALATQLDVMSAGYTPDEARRALHEAVHLFLTTAADAGTLAKILDEAGYQYLNGCWERPAE